MSSEALHLQRRVLWLVLAFLILGHIMLFSATGILGLQRHGSEFYFIYRQFWGAVFGLALLSGLAITPYQWWGRLAYLLLGLQIVLVAATYLPGIGHHASGATRWLRLGPLLFQPSEFSKITVGIYFSTLLAKHQRVPLSPKQWAGHLAPLVVLLGLIFRQPDLGTTALLCAMMLSLLFLAGVRFSYFIGLVGVGTIALVVAMLQSDYRRRRVATFLNPWLDPQGSGFQTIQSFLSIHSGKIFGVGLGNGNSKLFFLPEVHTDFIFSLVGEELGFIGAFSLLILFCYFSYLIFKIAFEAKDSFGTFLAFSLAVSLVLQTAVNLGGVTGMLPLKGLPLPFISWGRSALIVNLAMVGILLNIVRQSGRPAS